MKSSFLRFVLPLAALAFVAPGSALAQGKGKGDSGPVAIPGGSVTTTFVIDKPGSYVLAADRTLADASQSIISIQAPDVTLDLAGFALTHGTGAGAGGHGILVADVSNVEIRNGSVLNIGGAGIHMFKGQSLRVLDVRVIGAEGIGIYSGAEGTVIDRCHVSLTKSAGVNLFGRDGRVSASTITRCETGISVVSRGGMVVGNTIDLCEVAGIRVSEGALVQNNVVTTCNTTMSAAGAGIVVAGYAVTVRDNVLHINYHSVLLASSSALVFLENNTIATAAGSTMLNGQSGHKSVWRNNRYLTQPGVIDVAIWVDGGGNISNN